MAIVKIDAINTSKAEEISSASTINPWVGSQLVPVSGTATISNFTPAPHAGVTRTLLATGAFTLQSSLYFKVFGGTQTVEVGDMIEVTAIYTNQFYLRVNHLYKQDINPTLAAAINNETRLPSVAGTTDANAIGSGVYSAGTNAHLLVQLPIDKALADAEATQTIWDFNKAVKTPPNLLREMVESASNGAATVLHDDLGFPSIMYIISGPILNGHLHPNFGGTTLSTDAFPAFKVNGVEKREIYIGMFNATEYNGRAVVWPGLYATGNKTFTQAKTLCTSKGSGWHLMSIWENALVEWLSMKKLTEPRGNNYYGRSYDIDYEYECAVRYDNLSPGDNDVLSVAKHRNGSCPETWSHNGTRWGVFDMNGNMWRWVDQLKTIAGQIYLTNDNYYSLADASWPTTGAYFDGFAALWGSTHTGPFNSSVEHILQVMNATYNSLSLAIRTKMLQSGVATKLNQTTANPFEPKGHLYTDASIGSENFPLCGGDWIENEKTGIAALNIRYENDYAEESFGFRPCYIQP